MHYHRKPGWMIPESKATPESVFMQRRKFLAGSAAMAAGRHPRCGGRHRLRRRRQRGQDP